MEYKQIVCNYIDVAQRLSEVWEEGNWTMIHMSPINDREFIIVLERLNQQPK